MAKASRRQVSLALAVFFGSTAVVYVAGGLVTASSVGSWYQTLAKPSFNPPDWVFAPVWSALYLIMAVAGWWAWRRADRRLRRRIAVAYSVQIALNFLWSVLFFGFQWIGVALVEIAVLLVAILWTVRVFWHADRRAAIALAPYAAWVSFAAALNFAIWRLN